ncbi:DUF4214 domain-containing protein [Pseudomonas fluorescens]|uniref:DUF4214 domain-containing protein n=1 Tax=Pseudomonas fluorescens TaxID=294 RepID=A0A5E7AZ18_PSEFL|nr:DUF4214 domain-containing protein [Pseudomonas fluorescens]VVN83865.1 hypothetical protein PS723_01309 [Pseudomonas fluorescens]
MVISNLSDSIAWAGVGSWVTLDRATDATVSNTTFEALNGGNGNWNGATLTIHRVTGGSVDGTSRDQLQFIDNGSFSLQEGNAYSVYPTQSIATAYAAQQNATGALNDTANGGWFARWSYTYATGTLTIQFGAAASGDGDFNQIASTALVQSVLRSISYRNDTPTGDTTIRFSLSDGATATNADVTVTTNYIYVTNTTDTATIDVSNGISFSEAIAIANAHVTGSQTLVLDSTLTGQSISASDNPVLSKSLKVDGYSASGASFGSGTMTLGAGVNLTFSNGSGKTLGMYSGGAVVAGEGGLIKEGAGQLKLYGTNTHSGGTSILGGTLQLPDQLGLGSGTVTLDGGGLSFMSNPTITNAMVIGTGGGSIDGGAPVTISGNISGSGTLTLTGGTKTLSGTNTHAATVVTSGGLTLSGGAAIADTGSVTVASGATLTLSSSETIGSLAGAGTVALGANTLTTGANNTSTTLSGAISGSGALAKTGSGILSLSGFNTYTGATTVSAGGLTLQGGNSIADTGAVMVASHATLTLASGAETIGSLAGAGNVVLGYKLTTGGDNSSTTFSGVISGIGNGLTKTGSGTLTLTGHNTYTGSTTVSNGTLALTDLTSISNSSAVTVSTNGTLMLGSDSSIGSLAGAGSVTLGANTLNVGNSNATDFSGVISGTGHLLKQGSGTLTLSATDTYTGATFVNVGTLLVNGALANSSSVTVASGATLGGSGSIGTGSTSGAVTVQSGGTLAAGNGVGTLTLHNGLTVAAGGTIAAQINGNTAGTGYDQIKVYGAVNLTGANLSINLSNFTPAVNDSFVLISNDGTDAITGTVTIGNTMLIEGGTFSQGGKIYQVSYKGGDGNDLVLMATIPNTAPTLTGVPNTAQAVTVGVAAALADFTVADTEQGTTNLSVTLTASNGTINGVTDTDNVTAGIQLSGTAAAINTALAAATFTATAAGAASIGISVSDGAVSTPANYSLNANVAPAPTPVLDKDGVPDAQENSAPGLTPANGGAAVAGDGNGDGIADSQQAAVASVAFLSTPTSQSNPASATPVYVTLVAGAVEGKAGASSATLNNVHQLDAPANLPADLKLPMGLISFSSTVGVSSVAGVGVTETFSLYVDPSVGANAYFKQNAAGTWVNLASSEYGGKVVSEGGKTRLDFSITDGGQFDDDHTINGVITDPGGVGFSVAVTKDADHDQFPDALEAANGLTVGVMDNNVFTSSKLFAMQMYRDILYREGEGAGVQYWQGRLDAGVSHAEVATSFLDSTELQGGTGAIARLYFGSLNRLPDAPGMSYWMDKQQLGTPLSQIAAAFAASPEFTLKYAGLDNPAFIESQYQSVLGRSATVQEQTQWATQLVADASRGVVLLGLTESAEYKAASETKLSVAMNYLGLLGRPAEQAGFDYWVNQQNTGVSEITVVGSFIASQEFHDRFLP